MTLIIISEFTWALEDSNIVDVLEMEELLLLLKAFFHYGLATVGAVALALATMADYYIH